MWTIILIETLVISLLGSLLHFTYAWSKQNKFVAIFSAVNESTWEHIKLALSGIFACTLVDVWFLGDNHNYWLAKSLQFVVPVFAIPIIFYLYQLITKRDVLILDILTFFVAAFLCSLTFAFMLELPAIGPMGEIVSLILSATIIVMYLLLTRFPMHNFLFRDPLTGKYGYDGHARHHHKHRH